MQGCESVQITPASPERFISRLKFKIRTEGSFIAIPMPAATAERKIRCRRSKTLMLEIGDPGAH
jgi:hypothetical protein